MLKKEVRGHLLVTLFWLVIVTLLRLPGGRAGINAWLIGSLALWLGGLVGTFLLDLDHLLYTLWIYTVEPTSLQVKSLVKQNRFKEALVLLVNTHNERWRLSFHSALFQPIFYFFCFWVLSSTPNLFGKGLVVAMALHLLKDEFESLFTKGEESTRRWLFWQIKREITFKQQKFFLFIMLLFFLGLNLLLI